jgi:phosphotransferase family enzyme
MPGGAESRLAPADECSTVQDVAGTPGMTWLAECSAAALGEALRVVVPELSGYPVTVPGPAGKQDPQWHAGCEPLGDRFFVKFAWSRPAALQLAHEISVLAALAREPAVPFLPEVVASSTNPLLLITRRVPGASLFDVVDSIDRDRAARQIVHGDFHGNNQVWDRDELRLVMDFATAGAAEPEYELRTLPGPGLGPGLELLTAVMRHYQQATGRHLSADRLMAWHLRQALYDTLWHSEAGIPLNDHRTPPEWVDDLAARFSALGIDPEVPTTRSYPVDDTPPEPDRG